MSQKFIWNEVYHMEEAGRIFVDGVLCASLIFFGAELVDLGTDYVNSMEVDGSNGISNDQKKRDN
jgi:hypothetical protein